MPLSSGFTRFDHLQRHALVHDESAVKLPCPDCGKTFLRHDMLVRHQRSVHDSNNKNSGSSKSKNKNKQAATAAASTSSMSSVDMTEQGPSKKAKPASMGTVRSSGMPARSPSSSRDVSLTLSSTHQPSIIANSTASSQSSLATSHFDLGLSASSSSSTWRDTYVPSQRSSADEVSPTSEKSSSWSSGVLSSSSQHHSNGSSQLFWFSGPQAGATVLGAPSSSQLISLGMGMNMAPAPGVGPFEQQQQQNSIPGGHGAPHTQGGVDVRMSELASVPNLLSTHDMSNGSGSGPHFELAKSRLAGLGQGQQTNTATFVPPPAPSEAPPGLFDRSSLGEMDLSGPSSSATSVTTPVSSASSTYSFPAYNLTASFPSLPNARAGGMGAGAGAGAAWNGVGAGVMPEANAVLPMRFGGGAGSGTPTVPSQLIRQASEGMMGAGMGMGMGMGAATPGMWMAGWQFPRSMDMPVSAPPVPQSSAQGQPQRTTTGGVWKEDASATPSAASTLVANNKTESEQAQQLQYKEGQSHPQQKEAVAGSALPGQSNAIRPLLAPVALLPQPQAQTVAHLQLQLQHHGSTQPRLEVSEQSWPLNDAHTGMAVKGGLNLPFEPASPPQEMTVWPPLLGPVNGSTLETHHQPGPNETNGANGGSHDGSDGKVSGHDTEHAAARAWLAVQADVVARDSPHLVLSNDTHRQLLELLHAVPGLSDSPLFIPPHISVLLSLFFHHFNRLIPLLHEPTFRPDDVCPALLAACVAMGSYFVPVQAADGAVAMLGVQIADKLWAAVVSLDEFHPQRITLELLQSLIILDAYGTFCASRHLHELVDCFHPLIVTFARRNALFDSSPASSRRAHGQADPARAEAETSEQSISDHGDDQEGWRTWIEHEEKIRAAHVIYALDVLHAALFGHKPALGGALPRSLSLPADDGLWRARTAQAWAQARGEERRSEDAEEKEQSATMLPVADEDAAYKGDETPSTRDSSAQKNGDKADILAARLQERPHFGAALKACFAEHSGASGADGEAKIPNGSTPTQIKTIEDPFVRLLLFIGLVGMAYDLNHHSGLLLDRLDGGTSLQTVKEKVFGAMARWSAISDQLTTASESDDLETTAALKTSIHIAGKLTMHADIIVLQIACEVNPLLGQYISAAVLASSRVAVREWRAKPEARTAALAALQGLRLLVADDTRSEIPFDCGLVKDRVCYLCCIVLFACTRMDELNTTKKTATMQPREAVKLHEEALNFLASTEPWTTERGFEVDEVRRHLGGILCLVRARLAVARWELSREADATLGRLLRHLDDEDGGDDA
ncbi:hypothetical protein OC835_002169 [Tilletia horrida]|nr:hypothetical protein OC835_002169 [Tilletia horrida]